MPREEIFLQSTVTAFALEEMYTLHVCFGLWGICGVLPHVDFWGARKGPEGPTRP